ncbi:MAG: hypothetical protein V3V02_09150 [Rhizobiaceae bacterium]
MRNFKTLASALAGSLLLASCTTQAPVVAPEIAVAPAPVPKPVKVKPVKPKVAGINGKWVPTNESNRKIYYNRFRNGKFVSKSPDGKSTLAAGTYKTLPNGDIQMNWYSAARNSNSTAMCKQLSKREMQCTSNGSVFNLRRA